MFHLRCRLLTALVLLTIGASLWPTMTLTRPVHAAPVTSVDRVGNSSLIDETLSVNFPSKEALQPSNGASRDSLLAVLDENLPPTAPTNLRAEDVTTSSLTLHWDAASDDVGVTSYRVYQNGVPIGTTSATTLVVSRLYEGRYYLFSVAARDAVGNVSSPNPVTGVMMPDFTAPTTPANLRTERVGIVELRLRWDAASDTSGPVGYEVYQDGALVAVTRMTVIEIDGLRESGTYRFTVTARDDAGNVSPPSSELVVTTLDRTAPTMPTNVRAEDMTSSNLTLHWDAASDAVGVVAYEVYQDGVSLGTTSATTLAVSGLSQATTYYFSIRARDAAGNLSVPSDELAVETAYVTMPTNVRAEDVTTSGLTLHWDNVGVVEYEVYQDGALLGTTSAPTLVVSDLSEATTYYFKVTARDPAGNLSVPSDELAVATLDVTVPDAPTDLAVVSTTAASVRLVWAPASDNVGVAGYNIYSGTTRVGSTDATVYTVTGLAKNKRYTFTIQAYDAAGNLSNVSSAVTVKVKG